MCESTWSTPLEFWGSVSGSPSLAAFSLSLWPSRLTPLPPLRRVIRPVRVGREMMLFIGTWFSNLCTGGVRLRWSHWTCWCLWRSSILGGYMYPPPPMADVSSSSNGSGPPCSHTLHPLILQGWLAPLCMRRRIHVICSILQGWLAPLCRPGRSKDGSLFPKNIYIYIYIYTYIYIYNEFLNEFLNECVSERIPVHSCMGVSVSGFEMFVCVGERRAGGGAGESGSVCSTGTKQTRPRNHSSWCIFSSLSLSLSLFLSLPLSLSLSPSLPLSLSPSLPLSLSLSLSLSPSLPLSLSVTLSVLCSRSSVQGAMTTHMRRRIHVSYVEKVQVSKEQWQSNV